MATKRINPEDYQDIINFSNNLMNITEHNINDLKKNLDEIIQKYRIITPEYLAPVIDKLSICNPKHLLEYTELYEYMLEKYNFRILVSFFISGSKLQKLLLLKGKIKMKTAEPFHETLEDLNTVYKKDSIMYYLLHDNKEEVSRMYNEGMQYENDSLINHAARFGSINCFRFLFSLNNNIDEKTLQNAYLGGNQEIIQVCENRLYTYNSESNAVYPDSDCVEKLIQTHQNEFLINIIEEKGLSNDELRKIKYSWAACHIYFNIDFFYLHV